MARISKLFASLAAVAVWTGGAVKADDTPKADPKPAIDPKNVRVGPPPELAELRKAVEEAGRKGENVDEIRKQLEALEKALAGKPWVKPQPMDDPPRPVPGPREIIPAPVPGFDPAMPENLLKAQELMLKAALLRATDPEKAEALLKEARKLLGANPGGLLLPPRIDIRPLPAPFPGRGSRLGIRVEEVPDATIERFDLPKDNGILAVEIVPDSPAEKAGLKAGDVLTQFNGKAVGTDPTRFVRLVQSMRPGEKVDIVYLRKGKKQEAKGVQLEDLENRRGGGDPFGLPLFPVPAPLPVPGVVPPLLIDPTIPVDPLLLPGPGAQKSRSVSVQIQDDRLTIQADEEGVKTTIEGVIKDGQAAPDKITIVDGKKTIEAVSVEKVPAEHRDRVKKLLSEVKLKGGK